MIVVYGASGTTGTLVAEELYRRGFEIVLAGRDRVRLAGLAETLGGVEIRQAAVHDQAALEAALTGAKVVVSCAGPFLIVGEPILRAAIAVGAHYLDTCGEQAFLREAHERCDARARRAGVAAVSGFAFEVALGDWAAGRAAARVRALDGGDPEEPIDAVTIGYAISHFRPSAGTVQSAVTSLARPGLIWHQDRWEPAAAGSRSRRITFPAPFGERDAVLFPSGEVVTVPRHVDCRRVETYLAWGDGSSIARTLARAAGLVGPFLPLLASSPLGALARSRAAAARPPDLAERTGSRFAVVAEAAHRFHRARVSLSGSDLYGISAEIVAEGVAHLMAAAPAMTGVLAPSELMDGEQALAELVGAGRIALEES
jgi:short subunit dehydrogenase-like uncharacterized protein